MRRFLLMSSLALFAAAGTVPSLAVDPDDARITTALLEHGFENVAVRTAGEEIVVWYENRVFRYEMTALGVAAALAAGRVDPSRRLVLIPQQLGIPLLAVSAPAGEWSRFLGGATAAATFGRSLRIDAVPAERPSRVHSPRWKTDLAVRPLLAFELGVPTDVFQYSFALAPELTLSPYGGTLLTGQVVVLLENDLNPRARRVAPGRSTLSWAGWLPGSWLLAASGGILPAERYGFVGEVDRLFLEGHLEIAVGGDLTGRLAFRENVTLYSSLDTWSAFAAATGRTPGVDLEVRGSLARFMEGDFGVRLDVRRRIHETSISFFGIKTESETVAGLQLTLPLPARRLPRPRRFRLATVPAFPIEYRDTLGFIGGQASHFNRTEWVRKGMFPPFVRNNIDDARRGARYVKEGDR